MNYSEISGLCVDIVTTTPMYETAISARLQYPTYLIHREPLQVSYNGNLNISLNRVFMSKHQGIFIKSVFFSSYTFTSLVNIR